MRLVDKLVCYGFCLQVCDYMKEKKKKKEEEG